MEKRASEKYYIIMSLILGLIVLSLTLYFIFNEYFTRDELDWQECRQSIYLRSISPEIKKGGVTLVDLKNSFPLKCKTEVVTIDTAEPKVVYGKIADTVAAGWFLFGEGEYDIVPRKLLESSTYCMVFARIHYTEKSIKGFDKNIGIESERLRRILIPPEGVDAVTGDFSYLSEPTIKFVEFNTNFFKYYSKTKMKNSKQTYNEYLPLLSSNTDSEYIYFREDITPKKDGLLFVYRVPKLSAGRESIFGNIFTGVAIGVVGAAVLPVSVPVAVVTGLGVAIWADKNIFRFEDLWKKVEDKKSIIVVRPEDLGEIGCTEFITIPA